MKKQAGNLPNDQQQIPVVFKKCKLFDETWERYSSNPAVAAALKQFITAKTATPLQPFGAKDRRFAAGMLTQYIHAGLTFDVSLIYKISGRDPTVFYLYAIASHDESGTAGNKGNNKQKSLLKRFDAQQF